MKDGFLPVFDDMDFVNDKEDEAEPEAFDVERWLAAAPRSGGSSLCQLHRICNNKKRKRQSSKSETINPSLTH